MRTINKIIVHCAATPETMDIGAQEIKAWHLQRGWSDIGYHYIIKRDGKLERGRPIDIAGAHARGHNIDSIAVCLIGGVDAHNDPCNNFTNLQKRKLKQVLDFLTLTFDCEALGHRDLPKVRKACPSFDVREWYYGNN